jgi:hypothetical protein
MIADITYELITKSISTVKDAWFVYKLNLKPTGHFYIGMASSVPSRADNHEKSVMRAIKQRRLQGSNCQGISSLYDTFSQVLFNPELSPSEQIYHVRQNIETEVIAVVSGKFFAVELEKMMIAYSYNDELNCNTACILNTPEFRDNPQLYFERTNGSLYKQLNAEIIR